VAVRWSTEEGCSTKQGAQLALGVSSSLAAALVPLTFVVRHSSDIALSSIEATRLASLLPAQATQKSNDRLQ
jgi:hypothetical protein